MTDKKPTEAIQDTPLSTPLQDMIGKQIDLLLKKSTRHKHIMMNLALDEYDLVCEGARVAGYHRAKFARAACILGTTAYLKSREAAKAAKAAQAAAKKAAS